MDTIQDQKKRKRKLDHGSEKSSQDSITGSLRRNEIKVDGEIFKMADDLDILPEIDYEDKKTQEWVNQEDQAFRNRHPRLTYEEATYKINQKILEELKKQ